MVELYWSIFCILASLADDEARLKFAFLHQSQRHWDLVTFYAELNPYHGSHLTGLEWSRWMVLQLQPVYHSWIELGANQQSCWVLAYQKEAKNLVEICNLSFNPVYTRLLPWDQTVLTRRLATKFKEELNFYLKRV